MATLLGSDDGDAHESSDAYGDKCQKQKLKDSFKEFVFIRNVVNIILLGSSFSCSFSLYDVSLCLGTLGGSSECFLHCIVPAVLLDYKQVCCGPAIPRQSSPEYTKSSYH